MTTQARAVLRTPAESFADIEGFPYEARHLDVDGLRIGYIDEGPADSPPVLLVHGWPAWSYLWRNVIPPLLTAGRRVVAADLIGFGRSDKPVGREDFTYADQVRCLRWLVSTLDLSGITLVCHDWGGQIALRVAAEQPDRFDGIVAVNALLPTGERAPGDRFLAWQWSTQTGAEFSAGQIIGEGCRADLPDDVLDAYDAPYEGAGPDDLDSTVREFPMLIPTRPDNAETAAAAEAWKTFAAWDKPFVTIWSDEHPVVGGGDRFWRDGVPGAAGRAHVAAETDSLYLVEDRPELVTEAVVGLSTRASSD